MIRKKVSFKEVLISQSYMLEAIVNIFEKKNILTKNEIIEEMRRVKNKTKNKGFEADEN